MKRACLFLYFSFASQKRKEIKTHHGPDRLRDGDCGGGSLTVVAVGTVVGMGVVAETLVAVGTAVVVTGALVVRGAGCTNIRKATDGTNQTKSTLPIAY